VRKPLAIVVSGAPGAGKSTLARAVADRMRLPQIERDVIVRGIERTLGEKIDRGAFGVPRYFHILHTLIDNQVSFVTDGTLYKGISENDIKRLLVPHAHVINLHARAKNEHQRFYDREMNREGHSNEWVAEHMAHLEKIYQDSAEPLELGVECIEVDTNDGFVPGMQELVTLIEAKYERETDETTKIQK